MNLTKAHTRHPLIDERVKEEMVKTFGEDHILSVVMGPSQFFVDSRHYLDINFDYKRARFGD